MSMSASAGEHGPPRHGTVLMRHPANVDVLQREAPQSGFDPSDAKTHAWKTADGSRKHHELQPLCRSNAAVSDAEIF
ncbi:uncharacterized protein LOC123430001 [Hordeum vulgare subsp. vulgare]|uniref:Predicted protein n=1 Tax=Hordeum vulgare subsp. vulgare TaxID=112509 RepID=F2ED49_HORVV|nr:uncharacterized protein LOC123430001 [Hordeum vulgare subsp. vulgare]BAK05271.1 predicted protein [Hordeum vulgare subsp. vulgare]